MYDHEDLVRYWLTSAYCGGQPIPNTVLVYYCIMLYTLKQLVTFQAILISDYINAYCKAIYADRQMLWDIVTSMPNYPVVIGFLASGTSFVSYPYSFYDTTANTASTSKTKMENIDDVIVDNESPPSSISGDSKGIMYYKITSNGNGFVHNGTVCKDWIDADTADTTDEIQSGAEEFCPAGLSMMTSSLHEFTSGVPSGLNCYSERSADSSTSNDTRSLRCCYKNSSLITEHTLTQGIGTYRYYYGIVSINSRCTSVRTFSSYIV